MNFPPYAKAIAGSFVGALASASTTAAAGGGVSSSSVTATAISALAGFVLPYFVPNGKNPKEAAQGIVVSLKLDVAKFVAYIVARLPELVQGATEAAISSSEPAPAVEAAPAPEASAPSADAAPVA